MALWMIQNWAFLYISANQILQDDVDVHMPDGPVTSSASTRRIRRLLSILRRT
jgi:hypothetical protein